MAWFTRQKPGVEGTAEADKRVRTEGLWLKCESCGQIIWKKTLDDNMQVCPKCGHHFRLDARARLGMLFDEGSYEELDADLVSTDPLRFEDSKTYARAAGSDAAGDGACGRDDFGRGNAGRTAGADLRHGAEVHRRQHGRGGGRKNHARD